MNVQDIHPDLSIESGILRNPLAIRLAQGFEKWANKHSPTIVVISDGLKRNLLNKGVPADKIHIVPNCLDTDFIKPASKDNPIVRKYELYNKFVAMYSGTEYKNLVFGCAGRVGIFDSTFPSIIEGNGKSRLKKMSRRA